MNTRHFLKTLGAASVASLLPITSFALEKRLKPGKYLLTVPYVKFGSRLKNEFAIYINKDLTNYFSSPSYGLISPRRTSCELHLNRIDYKCSYFEYRFKRKVLRMDYDSYRDYVEIEFEIV